MNISTTNDDIKTIYHILSRLNILPRYTYNTIDKIPITDGVFIGFEEGEKYQDMDRIVYVGCNNSSEKLSEVIERQFSGSKNEVPLRKHIGTALLISKRDSYYRIWQKDSSDPVSLRRIGTFYDANKEEKTEGEVSAYMRKHMSFSCIPVSKINLRKSLQKNLLSSLQKLITNSPASNCWLGRFTPIVQIKNTGIWHSDLPQNEHLTDEEKYYLLHFNVPTDQSIPLNSALEDIKPIPNSEPPYTQYQRDNYSNDKMITTYKKWIVIPEIAIIRALNRDDLDQGIITIPNKYYDALNIRDLPYGTSTPIILTHNEQLFSASLYRDKFRKDGVIPYIQLHLSIEIRDEFKSIMDKVREKSSCLFLIIKNTTDYTKLYVETNLRGGESKAIILQSYLKEIAEKYQLNTPQKVSIKPPFIKKKEDLCNMDSSIGEIASDYFSSQMEKDTFYKEASLVDNVLVKRVDDNLLKANSFILLDICIPFFIDESLSPGERKNITIIYNQDEYNAFLYKEQSGKGRYSCRTSLNWDKTLSKKIRENIEDPSNYPLLKYIKSYADDDTYRLKIQTI